MSSAVYQSLRFGCQGFGLIDILVSAALLSVASLGVLSLNELGMKSANRARASTEQSIITHHLQLLLSQSSKKCAQIFLDSNQKPLRVQADKLLQPYAIETILNPDTKAVIAQRGMLFSGRKVASLGLVPVSAPASLAAGKSRTLALLRVDFEEASQKGALSRTMELPLMITTASATQPEALESCDPNEEVQPSCPTGSLMAGVGSDGQPQCVNTQALCSMMGGVFVQGACRMRPPPGGIVAQGNVYFTTRANYTNVVGCEPVGEVVLPTIKPRSSGPTFACPHINTVGYTWAWNTGTSCIQIWGYSNGKPVCDFPSLLACPAGTRMIYLQTEKVTTVNDAGLGAAVPTVARYACVQLN